MRGKKRKPPIKKLPQGRKRTAYDWALIETEYVLGIIAEDGTHYMPSVRDLAQRHGPTFKTVHVRAARGDWKTKRQQENNKLATEMLDESRRVFVRQAAKANGYFGRIQLGLMAEAERRIEHSDSIRKRLAEEGPDALTVSDKRLDRKLAILDKDDMAMISAVVASAQKVFALGIGEPTERPTVKHEGLDGLAEAIAGIKSGLA